MADEVRVDRYWNADKTVWPRDDHNKSWKATYKSRAPRSDIIYRNTSVQIWVVFELADTRTQRLASVPDRKTLIVSWSSCLPRPAHLTETSNEIFDTDVHEYICPWIFFLWDPHCIEATSSQSITSGNHCRSSLFENSCMNLLMLSTVSVIPWKIWSYPSSQTMKLRIKIQICLSRWPDHNMAEDLIIYELRRLSPYFQMTAQTSSVKNHGRKVNDANLWREPPDNDS